MKTGHLICVITLLVIIGVIFLSGCISHSEEYEKIEQMEFEKDVEGLINALESHKNSSCGSSCRAAAIRALGKIGDERAVEPLIEILKAKSIENNGFNHIDYDQDEAIDALAKMGKPSVKPLIELLEDKDPWIRRRATKSLGKIEDKRAIPELVPALANWEAGKTITLTLYYMGWKANCTEERIHNWVARRYKRRLKENWEDTKQVLLDDVGSGNPAAVKNAVYAFIALGNEEIIPDLITVLNNNGNEIMAETYLNSGNKELSDAARDWARRNGYKITSGYGASDVNWGSM